MIAINFKIKYSIILKNYSGILSEYNPKVSKSHILMCTSWKSLHNVSNPDYCYGLGIVHAQHNNIVYLFMLAVAFSRVP